MAYSEADALARYARDQDADAFRSLVQEYAAMVFSTCRRILRNYADAEDASQDCFLKLARKAGELRPPLGGWLHHVAVQISIDMLRRKRVRPAFESLPAEQAARRDEPSWNDVADVIDEAISELPERFRVPIVLYYLNGRTLAEEGAQLDLTPSTVSKRLKSGVELLRRQLKQAGVITPAVALAALLSAKAAEAAHNHRPRGGQGRPPAGGRGHSGARSEIAHVRPHR
jgi:RNA polymerase sigma factor (sigma-70 family)